RAELRQYDELSTVSEVSEENSTSEHQVTERYTPTSSCGSTGTIKRIYHRAESPQRKYFQESHNEASVLDRDSVDLKDMSAELNASNDSGGTCIEVTPNDSADSLSMTFKSEEIRAIMCGAGGKATLGPSTPATTTTERQEQKDRAMTATTASPDPSVARGEEGSSVVIERSAPVEQSAPSSANNETAILSHPFASARVITVSAEIHQRGPTHEMNPRAVTAVATAASCRNSAASRGDANTALLSKEQQHPSVGVVPTVGSVARSGVTRLTESGPKEGSSTEPGTPSSTPTSNSSSSGRKERQNANSSDTPSGTKRS
ncbi:hypothetical protein BIW11_05595, partial [Tropilaelaps mercedesae]